MRKEKKKKKAERKFYVRKKTCFSQAPPGVFSLSASVQACDDDRTDDDDVDWARQAIGLMCLYWRQRCNPDLGCLSPGPTAFVWHRSAWLCLLFPGIFLFRSPPPTQPLKGCRAKRIFALQRGAGGPRVLTDGRIPLRPPDSAFVPEIAHLCLTSGSQRKLSRRGWSLRRSEKGFGTNPSYCVSSLKPPKM